jgi:hypothetical protein
MALGRFPSSYTTSAGTSRGSGGAGLLPFSQEPLVEPRVLQRAIQNRITRRRIRLVGDSLVLVCSVAVAASILGRTYQLYSESSNRSAK